jgi:hypothetical protein
MISNLDIWCLTSGSEGMLLRRCFLRQRSDERIEQQRRGQKFAAIFRRNTLSPESYRKLKGTLFIFLYLYQVIGVPDTQVLLLL